MESKEFFLNTKPLKLFFIAAIPGAISMLAASLYSIFDGIMVGNLLNDASFAAVNLAMPFVIINFAISDLIAVGSAVPISINLGKKKDKEADNIFTCACILIVITGVLMGAFLYICSPMMLKLMGAEGESAKYAVDYIRVYALCSPVITSVFAMDNYLRISGKIKMSMWLNIIMSFSIAVLEFVFLFVCKMSVWGAALANCICMISAAVIAFYPFLRKKFQLKLCRPKFSFSMIKTIVSCGMPTFLSNVSGRIVSVAINVILLDLGGDPAVSTYGILMYAGDMVQPVVYGICDSLQPAIGYNWGAERYDRVKRISKCCFVASAVASAISFILMTVMPEVIVKLFAPNAEGAFLNEAIVALRIFAISKLLQWFCFATQSYMTAVGNSVYAGVISISCTLIFPIVFLVVLYPLGLTGIWLNATTTMAIVTVLSAALLAIFNRHIKKISD